MKRLWLLAAWLPALALADSPFDGTWLGDVAAAKLPEKPNVYLLNNGSFGCESCVPPYRVKADGTDQPVIGHPYYDTVAVEIIDPQTVRVTRKKAGKISFIDTRQVSADGMTQTETIEDRTESTPIVQKSIAKRVDAAPSGAHALSGSWRTTKISSLSKNALTAKMRVTEEGMSIYDGNGVGYDAKFDGKQYPVKGDVAHSTVSVKRIDANTLEETDTTDGKVVTVIRIIVHPDGKTGEFVVDDRLRGTTTTVPIRKQS
jgi:hypothetical protein